MALGLIAIAVIFTLADLYIVTLVLNKTPWLIKGYVFFPVMVLWALVLWIDFSGDIPQMLLNSIVWITVCFAIPTIIYTIFSLLGKFFGLLWTPISSIFSSTGIVVAIILFLIGVYGAVFGWQRIVVKTTNVELANLPKSFEGYRIVHISDFHIGVYAATPGAVERIIKRVNKLKPDLIVFTGDLINSSPDELTKFDNVLRRLKAPDCVISVLGYSDYCISDKKIGVDSLVSDLDLVIKAEKDMGWMLLRNQSVKIVQGKDSIAIIGVESTGNEYFPNKSDLKKALKGIPVDQFKILLSHDPSHWRREVLADSDIQLTLSGHTHAMQFKIGDFSPAEWIYPEWGGLYKDGDQQLYVSTGIGSNIAFRFGSYPTIDLLVLHSKKYK
ncbi:MAG: metallophosphoesterase [Muribaculaceae bacterium]|nr:metallophosphoesterase [Muribaculaceae bacterium]